MKRAFLYFSIVLETDYYDEIITNKVFFFFFWFSKILSFLVNAINYYVPYLCKDKIDAVIKKGLIK